MASNIVAEIATGLGAKQKLRPDTCCMLEEVLPAEKEIGPTPLYLDILMSFVADSGRREHNVSAQMMD